jgi:hypothetical protein
MVYGSRGGFNLAKRLPSFRVPYRMQMVYIERFASRQIRGVVCNANLPYPNVAYGFDPPSDGGVLPRAGLLGWDATSRDNLLALMTPVKSNDEDTISDVAVRDRIDSARAVIVAVLGLNAAFEQVCEFEVHTEQDGTRTVFRKGGGMENPLFYDAPDIHDGPSWEPIGTVVTGRSRASRAVLRSDGACCRLGHREEAEEASHRRLVALDLQVPRAQRLRELAAFEDQCGQRNRVGLDGRVGPLRASADDLEAAVCDLSVEAFLAEPQFVARLDPVCGARVEHRPKREDDRVDADRGIAGPRRGAGTPAPKLDDYRLEL